MLRVTSEFRSGDHALYVGEVRDEIRQRHTEAAETALGEAWFAVSTEDPPSDGTDHAYGGVDVSATIHRQWDRVRGAGVEVFPLPALGH